MDSRATPPFPRSAPRTREDFLNLFAAHVGRKRVDQIGDELALPRTGDFRAPEKILIILFAARAGSNFFGQLLSSAGWFREIGESFRPSQLIKIRDRHGLGDCHRAAQWMIDNRGTPHAFGIKAGALVLIAAAQLGLLPEIIDRAQFVLLRRRDRAAQAVSMFKARHGGRMHSLQPEGRQFSDTDYDGAAIAAEIGRIDVVEAQFADLQTRVGKVAPTVYYEDICAEPERHVADVGRLMNLAMPSDYRPQVRLGIVRDELSHRWAERFREERPQLV